MEHPPPDLRTGEASPRLRHQGPWTFQNSGIQPGHHGVPAAADCPPQAISAPIASAASLAAIDDDEIIGGAGSLPGCRPESEPVPAGDVGGIQQVHAATTHGVVGAGGDLLISREFSSPGAQWAHKLTG